MRHPVGYDLAREDAEATCPEFFPLYCQHYREMQDRLARDGVPIPDFNPRLDQYFAGARSGALQHYTVRLAGAPVGYSNVWLTNDMHNGELIAREDTVYVLPEHRNGVGKRLVRFILDDLRGRGVRRVYITPVTDLRVGKIWQRMGFRPIADVMLYSF
jgi:GNAT superfamily N-acetyltransferase